MGKIFRLSLSNGLLNILTLLKGFFILKFLDPSVYGLWNGLAILLDYGTFLHFGSLSAMEREIPFLRGQTQEEKIKQIKSNVFSFYIGTTVICALLTAVVSLACKNSPVISNGFLLVAVLMLLQQLYLYQDTLLQAEKKFILLSKLQVIYGILSFAVMLPLVYYYKLSGLLTALIICEVIMLVIIYTANPLELKADFNGKAYFELIKMGLPIFLTVLLSSSLVYVDRIMIINLLGASFLGHFAIALVVSSFVYSLAANSVLEVIYPYMAEHFGKNKTVASLKKYVVFASLSGACVYPFLIGVIIILLPCVVGYFLPKYLYGVKAAQIYLVSVMTAGIYGVSGVFLTVINKLYPYIAIIFCALVTRAVLNYLFIKNGWGIEGVAIGALIVYAFYGAVIILYSAQFIFSRWQESFGFLIKLAVPLVIDTIVLIFLEKYFPDTALKLFIFTLVNLPFLLYFVKLLKEKSDDQ